MGTSKIRWGPRPTVQCHPKEDDRIPTTSTTRQTLNSVLTKAWPLGNFRNSGPSSSTSDLICGGAGGDERVHGGPGNTNRSDAAARRWDHRQSFSPLMQKINFRRSNDSFGSKASVWRSDENFRSAPMTRHVALARQRKRWARCGHRMDNGPRHAKLQDRIRSAPSAWFRDSRQSWNERVRGQTVGCRGRFTTGIPCLVT